MFWRIMITIASGILALSSIMYLGKAERMAEVVTSIILSSIGILAIIGAWAI